MTKTVQVPRMDDNFFGVTIPEGVFKNDMFNCRFEECTVSEIYGRTLTNVSFRKCNLARAKLIGVKLQGHIAFYECDMSEMIIKNCTADWMLFIRDSNLQGADIFMSEMHMVMVKCFLTGANLARNRLNIVADNCDFTGARFAWSDITGAFTECKLPFARCEPRNLPNTCSAHQTRCTGGGTFTYGGVGDPVFTPESEAGLIPV